RVSYSVSATLTLTSSPSGGMGRRKSPRRLEERTMRAGRIPWLGLMPFVFLAGGCESISHTDKGVLGGGAVGGATGALIGSATGHTGAGAAIGAGAGALTGALIGNAI